MPGYILIGLLLIQCCRSDKKKKKSKEPKGSQLEQVGQNFIPLLAKLIRQKTIQINGNISFCFSYNHFAAIEHFQYIVISLYGSLFG